MRPVGAGTGGEATQEGSLPMVSRRSGFVAEARKAWRAVTSRKEACGFVTFWDWAETEAKRIAMRAAGRKSIRFLDTRFMVNRLSRNGHFRLHGWLNCEDEENDEGGHCRCVQDGMLGIQVSQGFSLGTFRLIRGGL